MSKFGGPNGPVAAISILKQTNSKSPEKNKRNGGDAELDSVSSDEDPHNDPDNIGYSK